MRIRLKGEVISESGRYEKIQTHAIQSLLLNRLGDEALKRAHDKQKTPNLFAFTPLTFQNKVQIFTFVFSSTEDQVSALMHSFRLYPFFQIDNYVLKVTDMTVLQDLPVRERYLFAGKVLASSKDRKVHTETVDIQDALNTSAQRKLEALGMTDASVSIQVYSHKRCLTHYQKERIDRKGTVIKKAVNIPTHDVILGVEGDYRAVEALYAVGFGQNTGTGNGLLWEARL